MDEPTRQKVEGYVQALKWLESIRTSKDDPTYTKICKLLVKIWMDTQQV